MSKQFETVARWLDKLNYVETDDKTINKTGNSVIHDPLTDDYKRAAEYWQRMYEQTFAERTCHIEHPHYGDAPVINGQPRCSECKTEFAVGTFPNYCPNCGAHVIKSDQDLAQGVDE